MGQTVGTPVPFITSWSSSPKPGAVCTMPVPSSVVTCEPTRVRKAFCAAKLGEVGEQRLVLYADELGSLLAPEDLGHLAFLVVGVEPGLGEDVLLPGLGILDENVIDVGAKAEAQVRRQGPGRRRPG
jgi:hypothetical protein